MAQVISTLASSVPAPVDYVLMRGLLSAARKRCPYFVGTMPGTLEKNQGSASVKWRRIENLDPATTALAEITGNASFGMGRDSVQASITDVTVAIAKYGNAITFNEELDLINVNSRAAQLMDTLGANAGESLNILMRDVFDASTNIRYASNATATTSITSSISVSDIQYCVNQLNRESGMKFASEAYGSTRVGSSPLREAYIGICHVDVEEDVRGLSNFIGVEQYGGHTRTYTNEFGSVGGVRWISTEIAPIATSGATESSAGHRGASDTANDVYSSFVIAKEAVGSVGLGDQHTKEIYLMGDRIPTVELIKHNPGSSGVGDMFNEVGTLAWKSWFAGKILNNNWIIKLETLANDLS